MNVRRKGPLGCCLLFLLITPGATFPQQHDIQIVVNPDPPFIERRDSQQIVNLDLLIRNNSLATYTLVAIKVSVFDSHGMLEIERELNENGNPPALNMVGSRQLSPDEVIDVYQPFDHFDSSIDLSPIHLEFLFMSAGHIAPLAAFTADRTVTVDVRPKPYNPQTSCLPLKGLVLVHDGHDYFSHHRRYNLAVRFTASPVTAVSANLYAYDLMVTTDQGLVFKGDPNEKNHWLSYGAPIYAPEAGLVIDSVSDVQENSFNAAGEPQSPPGSQAIDPNGLGNHVTIRHSDGRVSWLLHMQPGSVSVKTGDRVRAGQHIGRIGFSGDSLFPHLHFNVTDGATYPSQGVPSYFRDFTRVLGQRRVLVLTGEIDTGDLIESNPSCH